MPNERDTQYGLVTSSTQFSSNHRMALTALSSGFEVFLKVSMGNSSSNKRDRASSTDSECPASPCKEDKIFEFGVGNRKGKFIYQPSLEECDDIPGVLKNKNDQTLSSTTSTASSECTQFPTVFKWEGGGKKVLISGTFSDWKPIPMVESHGDFALILNVPEGEHQYKFLVDGQWIHSSSQPTADNDMGTKNNVLTVQKSDFEVFEALALDSSSSSSGNSANCNSPAGSYSQEIPPRRPYDKSVGPPVLPPHLLEVILNKDVASNNEPILLPEPNHVMLNHLYALSIKDGVMILSATLRYKKKYVTTLMYKPI
ncbi:5'-AMP-activated protein kinase subunit beta-1 [Trichonephila clavata]|uniref:5'-AMP-activated protein kinase subunit beta-1 n=1 Tax=Trichonephila clavata TaxID=2740835 RepID=A0A8X6H368_TRICU|nr:5'-AMP-activated protein kinase subunit beta-1 [Trichonephila clavata]